MKPQNIPTQYRGYEFRSRLEAKWAVFFDLCGWVWSYEPKDFQGWIPDFAIGEWPTLVECKPFFKEEEWLPAISKIRQSGCAEPVILFGADPCYTATEGVFDTAPVIGWLLEPVNIGEQINLEISKLNFGFTEGNNRLGLCSLNGAWWNPIFAAPANCLKANKWSRVWLLEEDLENVLVRYWSQACNTSRWIPVKNERYQYSR